MKKVEKEAESYYADDPLKPMSYSNTIDLKYRISYQAKDAANPRSGYIEQFDNKYYDAIQEKNAKIQEKKDVANEERVRQQQ